MTKNNWYQRAKLQLHAESEIADSLFSIGLISDAQHHFYRNRTTNLGNIMDIETNRLSAANCRNLLASYQTNTYGYPEIYHKKVLEAVLEKFIYPFASSMNLGDFVDRDHRQLFDMIDTSKLFPEDGRRYLLELQLGRIHSNFSRDDFRTYYKKFERTVNDSSLVNIVKSKYILEFDSSRVETSAVILSDLKGNKLTLDELKKKHKGKVIYADFWASWCGPCRESLPASAALRQSLEDKHVVFVYLSIDNHVNAWRTAAEREKLDGYADSYLIVNHKTSEFLKKNKLNEIPRYMIFDKAGRLTHANAPRVETAEAGLLLTKLADNPQ